MNAALHGATLVPFGSTTTGLAPPQSKVVRFGGSDIDVALLGLGPLGESDGTVAFFGSTDTARHVFMLQRMAEDRVLLNEFGYSFASRRYRAALETLDPSIVPLVANALTSAAPTVHQRTVDATAPAFTSLISRAAAGSSSAPHMAVAPPTLASLVVPSAAAALSYDAASAMFPAADCVYGPVAAAEAAAAGSPDTARLRGSLFAEVREAGNGVHEARHRARASGKSSPLDVVPTGTLSVAAVAPAIAAWYRGVACDPSVVAATPDSVKSSTASKAPVSVATKLSLSSAKRNVSVRVAGVLAAAGLPTEALTHERIRVPVVKVSVSRSVPKCPSASSESKVGTANDAASEAATKPEDKHAAPVWHQPFSEAARDSSRVVCDISVNNSLGILNSRLLRTYARCDPRFPVLTMLVKQWAQANSLHGAQHGRLSSYAWAVLVLFYLQTGPEHPVLPRLQALTPFLPDDTFAPFLVNDMVVGLSRRDWGPIASHSLNKDSIATLLTGFFTYYARFDFGSYAVSPRLGCVLPTGYKTRYGHARPASLYIEDPLDVTHNLARQCSRDFVSQLSRELFRAARVMEPIEPKYRRQ